MTRIQNGGGLDSEEVLFTNCNYRFLLVWSSGASLFMSDVELVHELSYKPMICSSPSSPLLKEGGCLARTLALILDVFIYLSSH